MVSAYKSYLQHKGKVIPVLK